MSERWRQYWLKEWEHLTTHDAEENTRALFSKYLQNSRTFYARGVATWRSIRERPSHYARISEVQATLSSLEQSTKHSTEYIIAKLKQEINSNALRYHIRLPRSNNRIRRNEFLVEFNSPGIHYTVLDPMGKKQQGVLSLHDLKITHEVNTVNDLMPYASTIFYKTSKNKHTYGGFIDEKDALFELLTVIQIKTGMDYYTINFESVLDRYARLGPLESIENIGDWKRQGLFLQRPQLSNDLLDHQQTFVNIALSKIISSVELHAYNNGRLALILTMEKAAIKNQLHTAMMIAKRPIISNCFLYSRNNITSLPTIGPAFCYICNENKLYYLDQNNTEQPPVGIRDLSVFLNVFKDINLHENAWCLTHQQIVRLMSYVDYPSDKQAIFEGRNDSKCYTQYITGLADKNFLNHLVDTLIQIDPTTVTIVGSILADIETYQLEQAERAIQHTIAMTIRSRDQEAIWNLATQYRKEWESSSLSNISMAILIQLYCSITEDSPRYVSAQQYLGLLKKQQQEDQQHTQLEQSFLLALKNKNQPLTDHLFFQLCGHTDNNLKSVADINGESDVLLRLAQQWREFYARLKKTKESQQQHMKPPEPSTSTSTSTSTPTLPPHYIQASKLFKPPHTRLVPVRLSSTAEGQAVTSNVVLK